MIRVCLLDWSLDIESLQVYYKEYERLKKKSKLMMEIVDKAHEERNLGEESGRQEEIEEREDS